MKNALKYLYLAAGVAVGRYTIARLISSARNIAPPQLVPSSESYYLRCTSGNIIHVEFDGKKDAPPIVLIHGLNSNSAQWYYQRQFLKAKYRLVFMDMPGHGKSGMPKDLSVAAIAEDLAYVIDYFKLNGAILYGHSLGAMATMKYCISYPESGIKGIILQHTTHTNVLTTNSFSRFLVPLQNSFIIPFLKFAFKNHYLFWFISWMNYLNGLSFLFYRYFYFTGTQSFAQLRFKNKLAVQTSPKTVVWALIELIKLDLTRHIKKINTPALVLSASHDRLTIPQANEFIHSQISSSELRHIPTGHFSIFESFPEVNKHVGNFIESIHI